MFVYKSDTCGSGNKRILNENECKCKVDPSYLSKFLDGEMFHNWVKYMLQLFMWTPRLDKVVGAIVSLVKVQNKRVALSK